MFKKIILLCSLAATGNAMELLKSIISPASISQLEEALAQADFKTIAWCHRAAKLNTLSWDKTDLATLKKVLPFLADYENGEARWLLVQFYFSPDKTLEEILQELHSRLIGEDAVPKNPIEQYQAPLPRLGSPATPSGEGANSYSALRVMMAYGPLSLFKKELANILVLKRHATPLANDFDRWKRDLIGGLTWQAITIRSSMIVDYLISTFGELCQSSIDLFVSRDLPRLNSKKLHPKFLDSLFKSYINRIISPDILIKLIESGHCDTALRLLNSGKIDPDAFSLLLYPALKTCHPGLVAALGKWTGTKFEAEQVNKNMPLHAAVISYVFPVDHWKIRGKFDALMSKIMETVNEYAPGSYSKEEIESKPVYRPEWQCLTEEASREHERLIMQLRQEQPSRFELGLPTEADCLAVIKILLERDHSLEAIGQNGTFQSPLMLAGNGASIKNERIIALIKSYYPQRFK